MNAAELFKLKKTKTSKIRMLDLIDKSTICDITLHLCVGAQIMVLKNDFDSGYVNGSRCVIVGFDDQGFLTVVLLNGQK